MNPDSGIKSQMIFDCKLWSVNITPTLYRHLPRRHCSAPSAVTIGNFDGVHLGHQAILERVHQYATKHGLLPTVMTFTPHPRAYFAQLTRKSDLAPAQISTLRDKTARLAACGMQQIVILRFNQALAQMGAEAFIRTLLVKGLNTRWLLVGEDFRFGHRRAGDIALLRRLGAELGFTVDTLQDVKESSGRRISSSSLRSVLAAGQVAQAAHLLGAPPRISGHVIHGRKLGRRIGFPTLNLRVPEPSAMRHGIYVVRVLGLGPRPLAGVASLGIRPTVTKDGPLLLETHILDASPDAYGTLVSVELLHFLRDEETFPDLASLGAAIQSDVQGARTYFASHGL
ncbi:MAG: bifunctional riboflavin kinase/FAD synthetase [Castellaniella sp.]